MAQPTQSTSSPYSYHWPTDLTRVGLTHEEILTTELMIASLQGQLSRRHPVLTEWKKREIIYPNDTKGILPRTVIVSEQFALVILGKDKAIEGGGQNPIIRQAYDPLNGRFVLKKRIFSSAQHMVIDFIRTLKNSPEKSRGFAEITHVVNNERKGKVTYYECLYTATLSTLFQGPGPFPQVDPDRLIDIQNALKRVHGETYYPDCLLSSKGNQFSPKVPMMCWHGDICPENIVYEPREADSLDNCYYKIIDWGSSMLEEVIGTPGWASPEKIRFWNEDPKYKDLTNLEFNKKYGRAGDVWSLALLFAALLRGRCYYLPGSLSPFPSFSFITSRLRSRDDGVIDDSRLATLTQKEIDERLDDEIASIEGRSVAAQRLRYMWGIIWQWLTVDPNKRPTLNAYSLSSIFPSVSPGSKSPK
jgi:hypothetical protein